MKTFNRVDLIPAYDIVGLGELILRAEECGMIVKDVLDIHIEGCHYKELLFTTTRKNYIKYLWIAIRKHEVELGAIPGIIKLMFMR